MYAIRYGAASLMLLFLIAGFTAGAQEPAHLRGRVVDEDGKPVTDLEVRIQSPEQKTQITLTDLAGMFDYSGLAAGEYKMSLNKVGFFRVTDQPFTLKEGENEIVFTVNHETEIHEQIEVYSSSESIKPLDTSHSDTLVAREIRDIPVASTHDLKSSLQTLPQVVRDNSGQLHVSGGRTGETQFLLDGFDIGDPASGNLSVRINVDGVLAAEVESERYGAQYGHAGAGVLALDTAVGDDRWRASANNFIPGVGVQKGIHLTSWYPRFTLSGPIHKERAWFSEALSVQHSLSLVQDLPAGEDSISQWAGDNLLRAQVKLTPKNMLQGSFLLNRLNASNLGLGPFSPVSTTRDMRTQLSFFSLKEQLWSGRTFYELGVAADYGSSDQLPKGSEPYAITPNGSSGNYFEALHQQTRRLQAVGSISMPTRHWHGTHDLQFGFNAADLRWIQSAERNAFQVLRTDGSVVQHTDFSGPAAFKLSDTLAGLYGNDTWHPFRALVLQFGLREDWDQMIRSATPSPRISANFLPFKSNGTKLTASWGVFVQPVTLSSLGPVYDQSRSDTFYGPAGPPPIFGPVTSRFVLPNRDLKQPRFYTASLGWEQSIGKKTQAEVSVAQRNQRSGLAYENAAFGPSESIFVLQNNRRDQYRSFQISLRHSFSASAAVSASYTRSRTRTNQVFDYSLDTLVFTPQQPGSLDWDAPNRVISSGWAPAPIWNLFLSYFFEYRTGFPFSVVNEQQQVVGQANSMRYPDYLNLNFGIEKRLKLLGREWAVRLTIINVTHHRNPDSVINNVDSPDFLKFGGGQGQAFTARVRLVG